MVIRNTGTLDDLLVAAKSDAAEVVELHTHLETDGIMRMRQVEGGFPIPAGGTYELARGGDHVMMMGLKEPLEDGTSVTITLVFENAGEIEIMVTIDSRRGQKN